MFFRGKNRKGKMYNSEQPKKDNSGWWIVLGIAILIIYRLATRSQEESVQSSDTSDPVFNSYIEARWGSAAETAAVEDRQYEDDAKFEALCAADPICSGISNGSSNDTSSIPNSSSTSGCPSGCTFHKSGCDVKGNVEYNTGEKIYHLLGRTFYNDTVINTDYGERWFCTETEAISNGWRKAKN